MTLADSDLAFEREGEETLYFRGLTRRRRVCSSWTRAANCVTKRLLPQGGLA